MTVWSWMAVATLAAAALAVAAPHASRSADHRVRLLGYDSASAWGPRARRAATAVVSVACLGAVAATVSGLVLHGAAPGSAPTTLVGLLLVGAGLLGGWLVGSRTARRERAAPPAAPPRRRR